MPVSGSAHGTDRLQVRPIAVFYHCRISGSAMINTDHAIDLVASQMGAVEASGLMSAASKVVIGINGDESDASVVSAICPKAQVVAHGHGAASELSTMKLIQEWIKIHRGWSVLYFHTKGLSHPNQPIFDNWRECMMRACVWNWKLCVGALEKGFDSVGAHWLTPEKYSVITIPYWGGNFFWAKSEFLLTLPPLKPATWENRFEAEVWIGRGPRRPLVQDLAPHWPFNCHHHQ